MKKLISIVMVLLVSLSIVGCAEKAPQPQNIDKNKVGVTSGEKLDQTDPTLIEGNLEDNDFKN